VAIEVTKACCILESNSSLVTPSNTADDWTANTAGVGLLVGGVGIGTEGEEVGEPEGANVGEEDGGKTTETIIADCKEAKKSAEMCLARVQS
jgi:hypothetical protein